MELEQFDLVSSMDMELSKTSFPYFFQNVLGLMYPDYMHEWLENIQNTDRTVIVCSRDFGKSVFMHSWAVWNLVFQEPPYLMVYVSSNQKQTMVHMREIDRIFTRIPALRKFKPRGREWAIGNMMLTNGNSILERSIGSQIRGLHPQEIIVDDPLKEFSLSGIQKVTDWFFGDMIPTLHHTAKLRMIGTPFTYTDIFSQLEDNDAYMVSRYPCINSMNESLWPERWTYDQLMQRKAEIGSLKFTREYLCVPISTGTALFNPEYVAKCKNKDYILRLGARKDYKYYVGVDPAISTDGDYNVIMVLEVDENMNKTVIHVDRAKNVEFRENIEKIRLIGKIFHPETVLYETNTFAKAFTQELRNISDLNVQDFNTTRKKKQEIILNLQMNIENGKLRLPYGDNSSRLLTNAIIEELSMFAITESGRFEGVGAHDDLVMALALANAATQNPEDVFMLLEDMGIFDTPTNTSMNGLLGLNF